MSYIGNTPFTAAFLTDTFSGNGSTVAFTMSVAPANTSSILVAITGVVQDPSTYSVNGTTLTFSAAPPSGTSNISVRYLGIPASGVTTTAYRTQTEFTATAGQTTFTVPSYTVGFIDVYRNGLLLGSADFTATTGTTVVLANAASAGDFIETVSFYVSSVLNALPQTGGTLSGNLAIQGAETLTGAVATNGASFSGASLVAGRVDSSNEGGQVDLCRASDNASAWAIDVFGNTSTPTLRFVDNIAAAARMVIDASGNLLVGTTSSGSARLYVRGSGTTSSTASFEASNSSGATRLYVQDDGTTRFFGSSGSETARIDSSGNLLVGVTSTVNSSKMFMGFSGGRGFGINDAAGGSGTQIVWFQSAGTQVGSITTTTTATSYNTSSDYRLKNVTGSLTGYKERLSALQPKQGSWKSDGSEFRGFLAHEFAVSYPTSVNGEKDAVDADGNPQYQGMQAGSSEVIADLVAYIKELETRLSALEQA